MKSLKIQALSFLSSRCTEGCNTFPRVCFFKVAQLNIYKKMVPIFATQNSDFYWQDFSCNIHMHWNKTE